MLAIYQINPLLNSKSIFLPYDKIAGNINPGEYIKVFEGDINLSELESIYTTFSVNPPADYQGRLLSVSDIIELDNDFYYCDSIGFKNIIFDKTQISVSEYDYIRVALKTTDNKKLKIIFIPASSSSFDELIKNLYKVKYLNNNIYFYYNDSKEGVYFKRENMQYCSLSENDITHINQYTQTHMAISF